MRFDERFSGGIVEFGETQRQIGLRDAPPLCAEQEKEPAYAAAHGRQQRLRQEMQQPEQGDGKLAQKSFKHGCWNVCFLDGAPSA